MKELKEAFRLYDKEGNGFIPTSCLKEILKELDDQLSDTDLDGMIAEIDQGMFDFHLARHSRNFNSSCLQTAQELLTLMSEYSPKKSFSTQPPPPRRSRN